MLTLYLIALVIGGTLIGISLIFGGDHDTDASADVDASVDVDADASADADAGADVEHDGFSLDAAALWIPFASVRFWIFFAAFFGLSGTLLTTIADVGSQLVVAPLSVGTGYLCGVAAAAAVKWLVRNEADSAVRASDMVGARGTVLLPVSKGETGKVRLELKGQVLDALATTEDDARYDIGASVMVYETQDDGQIVVTAADSEDKDN